MKELIGVLAFAALSACSTPYQDMGTLGGVQAVRITDDTAQIRAQGNGYTDPDTIQRYAFSASVHPKRNRSLIFLGSTRFRDRLLVHDRTRGRQRQLRVSLRARAGVFASAFTYAGDQALASRC